MPQLFPNCPIEKIVSGGQTGVDRAALAVAVFLEIPHGGWCPLGRRAEDGAIPACYDLHETESPNYAVRTEQNILDSDGTLILTRGRISGGTALTINLAKRMNRPFVVFNLSKEHHYNELREWAIKNQIRVLNVAGPRESSEPGITPEAEQFLTNALSDFVPSAE
ncbi:MAG: putative molybdenum carrier protein [Planctomycetaceae bacterium]|nr:putative molybdenum carrier protein [Planctomycetaceae bacterium]